MEKKIRETVTVLPDAISVPRVHRPFWFCDIFFKQFFRIINIIPAVTRDWKMFYTIITMRKNQEMKPIYLYYSIRLTQLRFKLIVINKNEYIFLS